MKTIAMGADHAGYLLKQCLIDNLANVGYTIVDFGTYSAESVDYPDFAAAAAQAVADGKADVGILVCGSGIGVSITANKIKGIRAANCLTPEMATLARRHNNANVLTLGERLINRETAQHIARTFLQTQFEGGRHERRVKKIHSITGC